ncbi:PREDICTED: uncharacterized protein LOC109483111 [Branchiostoma belcheri]|uniref:Uncharacterized protein LOC109483111 n=1 Tax=Branchiostoma belcheri TaxID=7741 RepID=A0A6P5AEH0_BRABE|nr:PREDICTED: uncharacterized protein LOC109483111 [Branchiostoma belcheri]
MRQCKGCKDPGECAVCYAETPVGQIVGLLLCEEFLKARAADRKVIEELQKKVVDELAKQTMEGVGQEAIKDVLLALETAKSPWMWSAIVTEFASYYAFKYMYAGSSEEDARLFSSFIGLITSVVTGGCVAWSTVGLVVGGVAWVIGNAIPNPVLWIMEKFNVKIKKG